MVSITELKFGVMGLLFLMSLGACALPFMVSKYVKNTVVIFSVMNCLSGGVVLGMLLLLFFSSPFIFLCIFYTLCICFHADPNISVGAALSHMIPSATENFVDYFANKPNSPLKEYLPISYTLSA